jgi:hypothetical protein
VSARIDNESKAVAARILERVAAAEDRWPDLDFNSTRIILLTPQEARVVAAVLHHHLGHVIPFPAPRLVSPVPKPPPESPSVQRAVVAVARAVPPTRPGVRTRRQPS